MHSLCRLFYDTLVLGIWEGPLLPGGPPPNPIESPPRDRAHCAVDQEKTTSPEDSEAEDPVGSRDIQENPTDRGVARI